MEVVLQTTLREDALTATPAGFELRVGLPWIRSMPLPAWLAWQSRWTAFRWKDGIWRWCWGPAMSRRIHFRPSPGGGSVRTG